MPLLSIIRDVCAEVGVEIPTAVIPGISSSRTMQEMLALANEMAQRIAYNTSDWTRLKTVAEFSGDGVTTAFNLPADYKRMPITSNVWRSSTSQHPMRFIANHDEWLRRRMANTTDSLGEWTMLGGQMHVYPVMDVGTKATFSYLQRNCVALFSGGFGDTFMNDADRFVLDERVLKLGIIWQWVAKKGGPYTESMGTYGDALVIEIGADGPKPVIVGRQPISAGARAAYPYSLSGPDWPLSGSVGPSP